MIRADNPHSTFDDLHDWYVENEDSIKSWFFDASRAFVNVDLSIAATRLVEQRLGRRVTNETAAAIGYIVTVSLHFMEQADGLRESGAFGRGFAIAWDDAKEAVRDVAVSHYWGLHPHAVAQINVAAQHIKNEHL